jgi:hypothetical protein
MALPLLILTSIFALLVLIYYTGSSYELWLERRSASTGGATARKRWRRFWWRAFVYSETALTTLVLIGMAQSGRGYPYLDFFYYPIRASLIIWTFIGTSLFLLFVSPFFFQRLGFLAIAGWILALVSIAWAAQPAF